MKSTNQLRSPHCAMTMLLPRPWLRSLLVWILWVGTAAAFTRFDRARAPTFPRRLTTLRGFSPAPPPTRRLASESEQDPVQTSRSHSPLLIPLVFQTVNRLTLPLCSLVCSILPSSALALSLPASAGATGTATSSIYQESSSRGTDIDTTLLSSPRIAARGSGQTYSQAMASADARRIHDVNKAFARHVWATIGLSFYDKSGGGVLGGRGGHDPGWERVWAAANRLGEGGAGGGRGFDSVEGTREVIRFMVRELKDEYSAYLAPREMRGLSRWSPRSSYRLDRMSSPTASQTGTWGPRSAQTIRSSKEDKADGTSSLTASVGMQLEPAIYCPPATTLLPQYDARADDVRLPLPPALPLPPGLPPPVRPTLCGGGGRAPELAGRGSRDPYRRPTESHRARADGKRRLGPGRGSGKHLAAGQGGDVGAGGGVAEPGGGRAGGREGGPGPAGGASALDPASPLLRRPQVPGPPGAIPARRRGPTHLLHPPASLRRTGHGPAPLGFVRGGACGRCRLRDRPPEQHGRGLPRGPEDGHPLPPRPQGSALLHHGCLGGLQPPPG
ncbi:hypothetical protein Naga_100414g2 [Nannochloropsis gaditana]|uniref:Uncharacterized protein n=1 Tax=Nannochloropsis gaditana TaxID=72520 RepID=W7TSI7_9STRA|nr:hypothetical protein Naga_100414g2 [Nannochloropsis gaditana]